MAPKMDLAVDDHADTRVICRELLTHFGYTVVEAADGVEALDLAFTHLPDLILLDFLMPHSDGAETLPRLRDHDGLAMSLVIFTEFSSRVRALSSTAVRLRSRCHS